MLATPTRRATVRVVDPPDRASSEFWPADGIGAAVKSRDFGTSYRQLADEPMSVHPTYRFCQSGRRAFSSRER
jgi:hypothetical protein